MRKKAWRRHGAGPSLERRWGTVLATLRRAGVGNPGAYVDDTRARLVLGTTVKAERRGRRVVRRRKAVGPEAQRRVRARLLREGARERRTRDRETALVQERQDVHAGRGKTWGKRERWRKQREALRYRR